MKGYAPYVSITMTALMYKRSIRPIKEFLASNPNGGGTSSTRSLGR